MTNEKCRQQVCCSLSHRPNEYSVNFLWRNERCDLFVCSSRSSVTHWKVSMFDDLEVPKEVPMTFLLSFSMLFFSFSMSPSPGVSRCFHWTCHDLCLIDSTRYSDGATVLPRSFEVEKHWNGTDGRRRPKSFFLSYCGWNMSSLLEKERQRRIREIVRKVESNSMNWVSQGQGQRVRWKLVPTFRGWFVIDDGGRNGPRTWRSVETTPSIDRLWTICFHLSHSSSGSLNEWNGEHLCESEWERCR